MVIRFYDFAFNLKHIEPKFVSSSWRVCYNAEGTFEAHFPTESEVLSLVANSKYLVAVQGDFAAVITGYEAREDFTVYGRTCNWILKKRLVLPFESSNVFSGKFACDTVSEAFSDVSNFGVSAASYGQIISYAKDNISTLYDVVRESLNMGSIGHTVRFDTKNKKWVFATIRSKETDLMVSESLKNASDTAITADILDLADSGYYKKRTENSDGSVSEKFTLLSAGAKTGIYRWEAILSGSSENEAKAVLKSKKENSELALSTHGIFYGKDYSLGDIVRVQIVKGTLKKTAKRRISGVNVRYSGSAKFEEPIFEEV